jgi:hypothetical protein
MTDTLVSWPAAVPNPTGEGLSIKRKSALRQAEMEIGPNRQRRLTTSRTRTVTVKWVLTAAQHVAFEAFFDSDIHGGADWFIAKWRLADGRQPRQVRFQNGEFESAPDGPNVWRVSATMDWRD